VDALAAPRSAIAAIAPPVPAALREGHSRSTSPDVKLGQHSNSSGSRRFPNERSDNLYSCFVQDQITLSEDLWFLTIGSMFEKNDYTGFEIQPSVRLLWTPDNSTYAEETEGSSPRNQFYLQSSWNLGHRWDLDLIGRYVDSLPAFGVPKYIVGDARLAWRASQHIDFPWWGAICSTALSLNTATTTGSAPGRPRFGRKCMARSSVDTRPGV